MVRPCMNITVCKTSVVYSYDTFMVIRHSLPVGCFHIDGQWLGAGSAECIICDAIFKVGDLEALEALKSSYV